MEENVFISLGSNLGETAASLQRASQKISSLAETVITGHSGVRLTQAVGVSGQPDFLNQVERLSTNLKPEELLEHLLAIEKMMGRVRAERWGPRIIDLDILFYGMLKRTTRFLVLPHPEVWRRRFFLEMIEEIDDRFLHQWERPERESSKS